MGTFSHNTEEFRKMADLLSDLSKEYKHRGLYDIAEHLMGIVIELHETARIREEFILSNGNNAISKRGNKT